MAGGRDRLSSGAISINVTFETRKMTRKRLRVIDKRLPESSMRHALKKEVAPVVTERRPTDACAHHHKHWAAAKRQETENEACHPCMSVGMRMNLFVNGCYQNPIIAAGAGFGMSSESENGICKRLKIKRLAYVSSSYSLKPPTACWRVNVDALVSRHSCIIEKYLT